MSINTEVYEKTIRDLYERRSYGADSFDPSIIERIRNGELEDPIDSEPSVHEEDYDNALVQRQRRLRRRGNVMIRILLVVICVVVGGGAALFLFSRVYANSFDGPAQLSNETILVAVNDVCTERVVRTRDGYDACKAACMESHCCRDANPQKNCKLTRSDFCAEHNPCKLLIKELCSEERVRTLSGRLECEEECAPAECCFDYGLNSCIYHNIHICEEYGQCALIIKEEEDIIQDEIEEEYADEMEEEYASSANEEPRNEFVEVEFEEQDTSRANAIPKEEETNEDKLVNNDGYSDDEDSAD